MKLNYDIDILPRDANLTSVGQSEPARIYFAAFRDPHTVEALAKAPASIRATVAEAGIAPEAHSSGVPSGHFATRDAEARAYLETCLSEAVAEGEPADACADDGAFSLEECLEAFSQAKPYGEIVAKEKGKERRVDRAAPVVYCAIAVLSFSGFWTGAVIL